MHTASGCEKSMLQADQQIGCATDADNWGLGLGRAHRE